MNHPSMDRLSDLQQLIADFAKIKRVLNLADNGRQENDAEHSFGLALTCWYLHPKIAPELDISKILRYALAHDIVEVHSGDTYIFDSDALKTKQAREKDAIVQLKNEWDDFTELTDFAEGYANKNNDEAKFVYAVDKIIPAILVELGLNDRTWSDYQITLKMNKEVKKTILISKHVSPYYDKLLAWLDERGNIPKI
jgi:putative hydrolases of HD superfamily